MTITFTESVICTSLGTIEVIKSSIVELGPYSFNCANKTYNELTIFLSHHLHKDEFEIIPPYLNIKIGNLWYKLNMELGSAECLT